MKKKIIEPIYIYTKDSNELWKYQFISDAEISLESYDIDNYKAYDSLFRELKLYKKDKYQRVGFDILNDDECYDDLFKYALNEAKYHTTMSKNDFCSFSLSELLAFLPVKK